MQMCSSDDFDPSRPSISRAITQTIDAHANINITKQFPRFHTTQDVTEAKKTDFFSFAVFPASTEEWLLVFIAGKKHKLIIRYFHDSDESLMSMSNRAKCYFAKANKRSLASDCLILILIQTYEKRVFPSFNWKFVYALNVKLT